MALATNSTPGTVYLNGDIHNSNDALSPELTATGVQVGTYNFPHIVVDNKGRTLHLEEATVGDVPCATGSSCGVVKIGPNLIVDGSGLVDVPIATGSSLGMVQPDGSFTINSGLLSLQQPIATTGSLGVVQIGANLTIEADGTLSIGGTGFASPTSKGLVQVGTNLTIAAGILAMADATSTTKGILASANVNNIEIIAGAVDIGNDVATKADVQTWGAAQNGIMETINNASGNITIDASNANVFDIYVNGNVVIDGISNMNLNQQVDLIFHLGDLITDYTLTLNSAFFKVSGNTLTGHTTIINCTQVINNSAEYAYTVIQPYME